MPLCWAPVGFWWGLFYGPPFCIWLLIGMYSGPDEGPIPGDHRICHWPLTARRLRAFFGAFAGISGSFRSLRLSARYVNPRALRSTVAKSGVYMV